MYFDKKKHPICLNIDFIAVYRGIYQTYLINKETYVVFFEIEIALCQFRYFVFRKWLNAYNHVLSYILGSLLKYNCILSRQTHGFKLWVYQNTSKPVPMRKGPWSFGIKLKQRQQSDVTTPHPTFRAFFFTFHEQLN